MNKQEILLAHKERASSIIPNIRKRLKRCSFSIISNTCLGTYLYRDFDIPYLSPTIGLYILPSDFVKFCSHLSFYLSLELEEVFSSFPFPIGKLGDIYIYFVHYSSFKEAKELWDLRKKSIDYEHLYFLMTDRVVFYGDDVCSCSVDVIEQFVRLASKNKLVFTHRASSLPNTAYLIGYENDEVVPTITHYVDCSGKKFYDFSSVDLIDWINGGDCYESNRN